MVVEEVANTSLDVLAGTVLELGKIGKWLQALGVIIVLWLVFQIFNFVINRKRIKLIEEMEKRVDRIEKKIDKILKKRK